MVHLQYMVQMRSQVLSISSHAMTMMVFRQVPTTGCMMKATVKAKSMISLGVPAMTVHVFSLTSATLNRVL